MIKKFLAQNKTLIVQIKSLAARQADNDWHITWMHRNLRARLLAIDFWRHHMHEMIVMAGTDEVKDLFAIVSPAVVDVFRKWDAKDPISD